MAEGRRQRLFGWGQAGAIYLIAAALLLLACYELLIFRGAGGDLMLRISEAKYFAAGINPYDVYVGRAAPIPGYGHPNAYSFVSYFLMWPLTFVESTLVQKQIFAVADIVSFLVACRLALSMAAARRDDFPISRRSLEVVVVMMLSVFFWQQIYNLNYNIIVALGVCLVFFGISRDQVAISVIGIVLVSLKPSMTIPLLFILLAISQYRIFLYACIVYAVLSTALFLVIDVGPIDYLVQLQDTQNRFSDGYTDGILYFLKPLVGKAISIVGLAISIAAVVALRRHLRDPISAAALVFGLGIGLFYNNVHAWIAVFPIIAVMVAEVRGDRRYLYPIAALVLFVCVPRLASLFEHGQRDLYVAVHNAIRFALLFVGTGMFVYLRQAKLAPRSARPG